MIFRACSRAFISPARAVVRWSHSLALLSHFFVSSARYCWLSLMRSSSPTMSSRSWARSFSSSSMPSLRSPMDLSLFSICSVRVPFRSLQAVSASFHFFSVSSFSVLKSSCSVSMVSRMSLEWKAYSSLLLLFFLGSAACWRKALTLARLEVLMRLSASAMARSCSSVCRTASRAPGLESFMALSALSSEPTAFVRSAVVASNSAISRVQRIPSSFSSAIDSSCFFLRSCSSVSFSTLVAAVSSMDAAKLSISSLFLEMASDLDLVVSLQKQANLL
mmetsp:Transcript_3576/g.10757  ORF Transcript_3576/g.10757 Transcript_3576/m.10757 type:complete len:276 (+) Transcript_3576:1131-1958(+)